MAARNSVVTGPAALADFHRIYTTEPAESSATCRCPLHLAQQREGRKRPRRGQFGSWRFRVDRCLRVSVTTIAAGSTTATVTVRILADQIWEGDETFTVELSNAINAVIGDGVGVVTIVDDDGHWAVVTASEDSDEVVSGALSSRFPPPSCWPRSWSCR